MAAVFVGTGELEMGAFSRPGSWDGRLRALDRAASPGDELTDLSFDLSDYELLRQHLRGESSVEQVAFMFCARTSRAEVLRVTSVQLIAPADFEIQTDFHVALADSIRPAVIKRAWDTDTMLAEAHSHVDGDPASFSRSDLAGFREWVPHMLWRLGGRPYLALVFARETFDALVWTESVESPSSLGRIHVDEDGDYTPTNLTLRRLLPSGRARH